MLFQCGIWVCQHSGCKLWVCVCIRDGTKFVRSCDSSILSFPFEFKLSCEAPPTYARHMQLLLYVTISRESNQAHIASLVPTQSTGLYHINKPI